MAELDNCLTVTNGNPLRLAQEYEIEFCVISEALKEILIHLSCNITMFTFQVFYNS